MSEEERLDLYPPWQEAVRRFSESGFKPGDVLRRSWLYEAFGLEMPKDDAPHGVAKRLELAFVSQFESFKEAILDGYNVDLKTKPGLGWEITLPHEQTAVAMKDGKRELHKALRRMVRRTVHVDVAALTPAQRLENVEAQVRLQRMGEMLRRAERMKLPPPE